MNLLDEGINRHFCLRGPASGALIAPGSSRVVESNKGISQRDGDTDGFEQQLKRFVATKVSINTFVQWIRLLSSG
jgi:hypothetical protein